MMFHLKLLQSKIWEEIDHVHVHLTYVHKHVSIVFMYNVHMKCVHVGAHVWLNI